MFRQQHVSVTGFPIADADSTVQEKDRGSVIPPFVTVAQESDAGYANWNILRPGDPANFMFWPLDPAAGPVRGAVTGSYSYAIPARKIPNGKFLPIEIPGFLSNQHEQLFIEEAGPDDWIILAGVKHGDRRKLAFRSAYGSNMILIADWRSKQPPTLSSIVHDGKGDRHDEVRKAGLHTAWEVREFVSPYPKVQPAAPVSGGQTVATPATGKSKKGAEPSVVKKWALSWNAVASKDGTGYCNVDFGDTTTFFSQLVAGPFTPSLIEKHWLGDTVDGPEIAGALSTLSLFRGSKFPYSAPLQFEEKPYPTVSEGKFPYWVRLWYDHGTKHKFGPWKNEERDGMWRWFVRLPVTETPKCTPTKDYVSVDTNSNPNRSYAEDSRLFVPEKVMTNGSYFQPRVNLVMGRKPDFPETPFSDVDESTQRLP